MITMNADGTLSLDAATLTTQEVDKLITELAKLRAKMTPPVPQQFDTSHGTILAQPDPTFLVSKDWAGNVSLGLRHPGLGWLAFQFPVEKAAALGGYITKRTGGNEVDTAAKQPPDGDLPRH